MALRGDQPPPPELHAPILRVLADDEVDLHDERGVNDVEGRPALDRLSMMSNHQGVIENRLLLPAADISVRWKPQGRERAYKPKGVQWS